MTTPQPDALTEQEIAALRNDITDWCEPLTDYGQDVLAYHIPGRQLLRILDAHDAQAEQLRVLTAAARGMVEQLLPKGPHWYQETTCEHGCAVCDGASDDAEIYEHRDDCPWLALRAALDQIGADHAAE